PTPTGAANAVLVRNLTITPQENQLVSRDLIRQFFGHSEQLPVAINAACDFEVEIAGAGAAGTVPPYGPLLRACSMSETVTEDTDVRYKPMTDAAASVTIYMNVDGVLHKMVGARGTVKAVIASRNIPVFQFQFKGVYVPVTDASPPTPVYTAWQQPNPVNTTFTGPLSIHGLSSAVMESIELDLANAVSFRTMVGFEGVEITDRKPAGTLKIEAVLVATKDWWSIARDATLGAFSVQQGQTPGNIVVISAPKVQIQPPTYEDQDGTQMLNIGLAFVPDAGNDEIVFTVK
ncbi:MAG: hypothetical protein KIT73_04195, partial [Burkholderiales bacterium]|nr:hypothetical protein [Burkholderiales bacterium]